MQSTGLTEEPVTKDETIPLFYLTQVKCHMVELYNKTQRLPSPSINASAPFEKVSMKQNYHNEIRSATRILKKKKLKINVHRPVGTRVVFDEEGNTQAPLAMLADKTSGDILLDQDIEGVVEDSISSSW
ncbi:hypothetical protein ES288_D01G079800v1 [Gossypium darwinii]|uniref:Uncharacterized protein n=1 Tax=Gossypium darwinii TaxID=34276 RepID=A0A5D2DMP5_GOSDA|nr:hypothetical protein ES288_D01G079800v1 [Gossypium darwinii]